jgi:hypothetical protein
MTIGISGTIEVRQMQLQRPPRLAVSRDRGSPWPVLRHWCHRLDDIHLQRDPGAGLVRHDPGHHRRRAGRRTRTHWWPSSALAVQPGTTATGGAIAETAWHARGQGHDGLAVPGRPIGPWSRVDPRACHRNSGSGQALVQDPAIAGLGSQRVGARMNRPRRPGSSASTAPTTVATTMMNADADSQLNSVNATPRSPYCCWLVATSVGR